jgi:enterochelin esterase-like enzyme
MEQFQTEIRSDPNGEWVTLIPWTNNQSEALSAIYPLLQIWMIVRVTEPTQENIEKQINLFNEMCRVLVKMENGEIKPVKFEMVNMNKFDHHQTSSPPTYH